MPLQCPHCHSTIDLDGKPPREVVCPSCGSSIPLDPGGTTGWLPEDAPKRLGKFELLERLGVGSFGTVYKARDTELDRLVAIKIPRSGSLPDAEGMERFLREARSAAQLKHPGIVALYDAGTIDGTCCLVSEFIQGATLTERLGARRFSFRQSAELLAEMADALHYAHQHGVVHRDLKPSNIMLDLEGRPHLMDFGLAKRAADDSTMTLEGQVLGTPAYMAPEQARGEMRKVDARSDLYSLGVIFYELLTGELPFRGQTRMLLVQVIADEPRPPRRLNDRIPRDLETICLKAMAKESGRRYATAGELADELRRFLRGEPIQARPVGRVVRAWRWCRRNPVVASLTATVAVALVAGTAVASYFAVLAHQRVELVGRHAAVSESKAREASRSLYLARMNLAQRELDEGFVVRTVELLDLYRHPPAHTDDPRGWEWYYLDRLCRGELRPLRGRAGTAYLAAKYSVDGMRLALAGRDTVISLWDLAALQEWLLRGHPGAIQDMTFSADGTRLASASSDGTVIVWGTADGQKVQRLKFPGRVRLALSPDGERLAVILSGRKEAAGHVSLFDVIRGHELRRFLGHTDAADALAFSPDGSRLVTAGGNRQGAGEVKLWDAQTGREVRGWTEEAGTASRVAFSSDGARLAIARGSDRGRTQRLNLYELDTGGLLFSVTNAEAVFNDLAFSPDGRLLVGSGKGIVQVWDVTSAKQVRKVRMPSVSVSAAFTPDGRLATVSAEGLFALWDVGPGHGVRPLAPSCQHLAFSPDGTLLAGASRKQIQIWDVVTGQELLRLNGHTDNVECVAFSPDGTRLASAGWDGTVRVWDVAGGREVHRLDAGLGPLMPVAFSPDGKRLAAGAADLVNRSRPSDIKIWDAETFQERHHLRGHSHGVVALAFSPNGDQLATASWDETVRLWDMSSGQQVRVLAGHTYGATVVAFSPDGELLFVACDNTTTKVWELASGRERFTLKGHRDWLQALALSPNGQRLATGGGDHTVKLWSVADGQEVLSVKEHKAFLMCVAFSPDGWRLASSSGDGTVQLRDARPLTPEVKAEVEAVGLLELLFAKPLPRREVRAAIQRDKLLTEAVRRKALEFVERYKEETDPKKYHAPAWRVIRHPYANAFMCQFALAQMNAACERAPDHAPYRLARGVAQHRLGKFQKERYPEALATLSKCDQSHPMTLAFLAMTQQQLGQNDQAQTTLARLRDIMKAPPWTANDETKAFLREAAELIEGRRDQPRP